MQGPPCAAHCTVNLNPQSLDSSASSHRFARLTSKRNFGNHLKTVSETMETTSQHASSSTSDTESRIGNLNLQSTLRITHPALLAAAQYNPSRLLASAPFVVLGEAPPNMGNTENLESSRDSGSSEEVGSTAEVESHSEAENAADQESSANLEPLTDMGILADMGCFVAAENDIERRWTYLIVPSQLSESMTHQQIFPTLLPKRISFTGQDGLRNKL